jgi:two-component system, NtrC family, sensor kinase
VDNKDYKDNRYYQSLTRNMVLTIILVSVMPLLVIAGITRHFFQVSYREKARNYLQAVVSGERQMIEGFFHERLAALRVVVNAAGVRQLTDIGFLSQTLNSFQREYGSSIKDLAVIDARGVQVAYAGPLSEQGADFSQATWFIRAIQQENCVSDVFRDSQGAPHVIITVRHKQGEKNWLVKAGLDLAAFNSVVSRVHIGKTGIAFIMNKDGQVQTGGLSGFVPSHEPYLSFLKSETAHPEEVTILEKPDSSGAEFVYVMTRLQDGNWVLAFRQDADEAFHDLYAARRLAVAAFLMGVVGIVAVALLLSRRTVRRIAQADQEKSSMNDQLIEAGKLASLGELAAGIAHEINNPVAVMVEEAGWMRDLVEDEDLSQPENLEEFRRCLSKIQTQGRRCKDITHKLLSFARKTDHAVKTVQLNELVQEVVGLSEQRALHNNVRMRTFLQEDLPIVNVSPSEVQQVLLNMLNNSFDALDTKGGSVEITSKTIAGYVVVEIADTGPGIPDEVLPRIFDPFFTTKPVGKGTGLGLSICYGIIKKMGGQINVTSAVNEGTTFHILFPLPDRKPDEN